MINWLLFFPDQQRWVVVTRYSICAIVICLAIISGCYMLYNRSLCEVPIGIFQLLNALGILLFCLADTYIHSVPHYANMKKKVFSCFLFIVTLLILFASAIIPTLYLEKMRLCSSVPMWVLGVETVVLSSSFVYIAIHIVLFIYHCNLRSQLQTMNIEEMRNHMIDPSILPEIFNVDYLLKSHAEIRVSEWIPQYREYVKRERKERRERETKKNRFNVLNPQLVMMNTLQEQSDDNEVNLTCAICMCDLEEDEYVYNLACKHLFHIDCLEHWYTRKDTCPLCKRHIDVIVTTEDHYSFDRAVYEKSLHPSDVKKDTVCIEMKKM